MLRGASADSVSIDAAEVRFTAGIFRIVWNWNILVPFGSGSIAVVSHGAEFLVSYRLSTVQMLVTVTGMICLMGLMIFSETMNAWYEILLVLGGGWLWLFGMNYLIAIVRFPAWLRRGLKKIPGPDLRP